MAHHESRLPQRRSILSSFGIGLAAAGAIAAAAPARAQSDAFHPAMHPEDDWYDVPNVKHRFVLDSTSPKGAGEAIAFAANFITANKNGYGLEPKDLAIIIIMRHFGTPFAYRDAMWAKYGAVLAGPSGFVDPKTKTAPSSNLFNKTGYGFDLPTLNHTIDGVVQDGVRFAVCDMATHFYAGQIAMKAGITPDAAYKELATNLIPNARLVPAGIVAVNRAQEHGYTLAAAG
jgi:hypothetical protein